MSLVHSVTSPVRETRKRSVYERFILDLGKREYSELGVGHDGITIAYHRFGSPIQGLTSRVALRKSASSREVGNRALDEENLQIGEDLIYDVGSTCSYSPACCPFRSASEL